MENRLLSPDGRRWLLRHPQKQSAVLVHRLAHLLAEVGRCNIVHLAGGLTAGQVTSRYSRIEQEKLGSG